MNPSLTNKQSSKQAIKVSLLLLDLLVAVKNVKCKDLLYCQAQFQMASILPVEMSLTLSLIITTPTHPHPTKKVETLH